MSATVPQFLAVLETMGSPVTYHRESGGAVCPCVTPEGFRDPEWHLQNPAEPVCNENGRLNSVVVNQIVKASVQPAVASRRLPAERVSELLGTVEEDDHIGIFPIIYANVTLDFRTWGESGEDFILYDGRRFTVVAADKVPDIDGDPNHHWETGLRLMKTERPT